MAEIGKRPAQPGNSPVNRKAHSASKNVTTKHAVKQEQTLAVLSQDVVIYQW